MDTTALVMGSALLTRQIVQELKSRGYIQNSLIVLITSLVINCVLAFGWAVVEGATPTVGLARAIGQTVLAALYHDWKKLAV